MSGHETDVPTAVALDADAVGLERMQGWALTAGGWARPGCTKGCTRGPAVAKERLQFLHALPTASRRPGICPS